MLNDTVMRRNWMDGIKGLGACVVAFFWHYQHFSPMQAQPFENVFSLFYSRGWLFVEVFFMLSGFGIALGYEDRIYSEKTDFESYILKRLKKLYPIFLLSTVLTIVLEKIYLQLTGQSFVYPSPDLYHYFTNLLMMQNGILGVEWSLNAPSWYLSVTLFLYAVYYYIVRHFRQQKLDKKDYIIVYFCLWMLGVAIILGDWELPIINSLTGRGLAGFFSGAFLFKLTQRIDSANADAPDKKKAIPAYLALIIVILGFLLFDESEWGNFQLACTVGVFPLLLLSIIYLPILNRLFSIKPLCSLGKISIYIYLLHFPVQCLIKIIDIRADLKLDYSTAPVWALYIVSTVLISYLFSRIIGIFNKRTVSKN